MAYRRKNNYRRKGKTTIRYGKEFKSKKTRRIGCYKYVNGKRVAFVANRDRYSR